jgi:hypothetical protein
MPEYLTTGEFTRWTDSQDDKIDRILNHIEKQVDINSRVNGKLEVLQASHTKARGFNAGLSTVVSALVSGLVTAFTAGK